MSRNDDVAQRENIIRALISQIPRRVEFGCIIKIETRKMFGPDCNISLVVPYLYGIVYNVIDYCHSTTASGYQVDFAMEHIRIPYNVWVLTQPVYENDMIILRFPDVHVSIDDANVDKLFQKVLGRWYKRRSAQTNFY